MSIPHLPACELEELALCCDDLWEDGSTMASRILAKILPCYAGACVPPIGLVTHGEPVTTDSEYLAVWFLGEVERGGVNSHFTEVDRRWGIKLVESGWPVPVTRSPEGISVIDPEMLQAASRIAYGRGAALRSALVDLTGTGLIVDGCTRARLATFAAVIPGQDALADHWGFRAEIVYSKVN